MGEITSKEDDTSKTLFLLQLYSYLKLILLIINPLENKRVFLLLNFLFKYLNQPVKKGVRDPFNQHSYSLGCRALQISGAVVRYIMVLFDHLHNHRFSLFTNVRMIIDRTRYCSNPNAAHLRNIYYRNRSHIRSSLTSYFIHKATIYYLFVNLIS
ncbi:hypothetical protein D3C78_816240 [compost metagenome]